MDEKTEKYIERLRRVYSDVEDLDSLKLIDSHLQTQQSKLELATTFQEHPLVIKMLANAKKRYKEDAQKLLTQRTMTQKERDLIFTSMDWGLWYIRGLGEDPKKMQSELSELVEFWARKAGVSDDE